MNYATGLDLHCMMVLVVTPAWVYSYIDYPNYLLHMKCVVGLMCDAKVLHA